MRLGTIFGTQNAEHIIVIGIIKSVTHCLIYRICPSNREKFSYLCDTIRLINSHSTTTSTCTHCSINICLSGKMVARSWSWSSDGSTHSEIFEDTVICRIKMEVDILLVYQKSTEVRGSSYVVLIVCPWKPCAIGGICESTSQK